MKNLILGMLLMLVGLFALSCSGNSIPVTPGSSTADSIANLPILVSDYSPDGRPAGGMGTLGVYSVDIDTSTLNYEMTPLRSSASQDSLEVIDITLFMSGWPCRDCVVLKQMGVTGWGDLNMLFGIKHPFPAPKFSQPISWLNRADLHLFNVEGLLVFDDQVKNFPGINKKISNQMRLTNADGYDGYLDASIDAGILNTQANLHPYRSFFVNYGEGNFNPTSQYGFTSLVNPSGYMVMKQASVIDQRQYYVSFMPGEKLHFLFVVQASYGVSSESRDQRLTPVYRCPQFNKKAASWVGVEITRNDLKDHDTASSADLKLKVLDINYNATVGTGLGQIRAASKVSKIEVELPGVMNQKITLTNPVPNGGDPRSETNPMFFNVTVINNANGAAGDYLGLVKVLDNYPPGGNTGGFAGMDGAARVPIGHNPSEGLITISEFATYQAFKINVATVFVNHAPTAAFHTIPRSDCGFLPRDINVIVDATESIDPDFGLGPCGNIILYEFDFDWDGNLANFAPDTVNVTGTADHTWTVSGPTIIGVRVTDGCTPPLTNIAQWAVTIGDPDVVSSMQTTEAFNMNDPTEPTGQSILNTTPMVMSGNNVYVAWTAYYNNLNYVYSARSSDGGCTWGPAEKIYHHANCELATMVFVALDKLANGDPILVVISPRTVICNYQAWWFHGTNVGENEVKWGFADAADLFGASSSFIDMVGHPTDPDRAYIVQWRTDLTPPQLMLIEVNHCLGPGDPTFPHMEVNLGPSFIIHDLDLALDSNATMNFVWQTSQQIKFMQVETSRPPIASPQVVVSQAGDIEPAKPRIDLDINGMPYVVYQAKNTGNNDIYLQVGTGNPVTFPNPSIRVNQVTTSEQTNPDVRFNTFNRNLWVVFDSTAYPNSKAQIVFERYDQSLNRITPINNVINTNDSPSTLNDLDPSIVCNPAQNSMYVMYYDYLTETFPRTLNVSFNRTN